MRGSFSRMLEVSGLTLAVFAGRIDGPVMRDDFGMPGGGQDYDKGGLSLPGCHV